MLDLQHGIDTYLKSQRRIEFLNSPQMSLGELIEKLEPIAQRSEKERKEILVFFDFEYLFPTILQSWRGVYSELALQFSSYSDGKPYNVVIFLEKIKEAIGKTYIGYKGGEFTMGEDTPIWVANYGNSGSTMLVDVLDEGYQVILITQYKKQ